MRTGSRSIIALCIAAAVAACGSGDDATSITYRAAGSVAEADVEYRTADGVERETVELPWSVSFDASDDFEGEIVVTNPTDEGTVECVYEPSGFRPVDSSGEVSAICGGSISIDGSTASGSFYSDFVDRDDVQAAEGVPVVADVQLTGGTGPDGSFAPFDAITIEVALESLTDEAVVDVEADTAPPGPGDSKSLEAGRLVRRGVDYDGDDHVVTEEITAPAAGWIDGVHAAAVVVEVRSPDELFEPVEQNFDLEFTVATPQTTSVEYEAADGQLALVHPSDWAVDEEPSDTTFVTNFEPGPPLPFDPAQGTLEIIAIVAPQDESIDARVRVLLEKARFTAPPFEEWAEIRIGRLVENGFEVTSDEVIELAHGPARRVDGTAGDESAVFFFTQSADRLYAVEFVTGPTADDDVVAAGEAVLVSVVFVPDAEPPATPLSEARIASFTVDGADGELASGQIALPATWTVAESLTEEAPSRFLLRSNAPARDDGLEPTQGYLYLEVLDPAPTTEDYAQFWIDRSAEQFAPAGYELLDQSEVLLNGESGVRTVWTAAGEVVDEAFVVTGAVGVTVRFEFIAGTENPALLDDVVSRVVLIPTE